MISGVVAQELPPLPRGVFKPVRIFTDDEFVFYAIVSSGLDQNVFPGQVADSDGFFGPDMPTMLTVEALLEAWQDGERIVTPLVAIGQLMLPTLYTSGDLFFTPDIRIPGFLQPAMLADGDVIFPTPLILDPGMLRSLAPHFDSEAVFEVSIDAAHTLFPQRLDSADVFYPMVLRAGAIGPPLLVSDDAFFPFSSQTVLRPLAVIDDGHPVLPATGWDGVNTGVNISSDGLNASLIAPDYYCGARSTLIKTSGKYYFEITLGPLHGAIDGAGLLEDTQSYTNMSQFSVGELAVFKNYHVFSGPNSNIYAGGAVITNNTWYTALASSRGTINTRGELLEGDVIGIAINLDNNTAWFRLNGGHWNEDQWGNSVLLNQDPATGIGGIPVPTGNVAPAVCLGGEAGSSQTGNSGDNFTANFGLSRAYHDPPPAGYVNWAIASPFGTPINGDSFGQPNIAIPARLDDGVTDVTMTNGFLTATHNTTNANGGAMSASPQNYGRYYFEVTVGLTHGSSDSVGLLDVKGGSLASLSNGTYCGAVYLSSGQIWSSFSNSGKTLGAIVAGDVVGVAVDLTQQTNTFGGNIWFRNRHAGVTGSWNGDVTADPAAGLGGVSLSGFSFLETWVPAVGFSGSNTAVGDNLTANFGQSAYAMAKPNGFGIWPKDVVNFVVVLQPTAVMQDNDVFNVPFIDLANRAMQHVDYVHDETIETIFPPTSHGGNLLLIPAGPVIDSDAVYGGGYFASFDTSSANVTLSNVNKTATLTTYVAYTGARSKAQKISGKYYFEVTLGSQVMGSQDGIGVLTENGTYQNIGSDLTNSTQVSGNSGIILSNNGFTGRSIGTPQSGEVIGCAIDLDLRKAWFRRNNGLWNGNASELPDTGNGSVQIQSLVSFAPAVEFGGSSPVNGSFAANFGATPFAYPLPSGFAGWSGSSVSLPPLLPSFITDADTLPAPRIDPVNLLAPFLAADDAIPLISGSGGSPTLGPAVVADVDAVYAATTAFVVASLDGAPANVTMSNGNLTATHNSTASDSGARSTAYKNSGKLYFEVTMTNDHGVFDCVGILTSAGTYNNLVTGSINCVSVYKNTGAIYGNNTSSGKTLGAIAAGDNIGVAVDFAARKAWLRKNGGNWNGLALTSENPNTGLGGVTVGTGAFSPAVGFGGSGTASGDVMTANFGATSFAFPIPSGFGFWTSVPDIPIVLTPGFMFNDDIVFPWSPSLLAALKAWYVGDKITGTDGSNVSTWADSSGLGNNASTGNPAVLKVAARNGLNVLQWGANFSYMNIPNIFAASSASSAVMVLMPTIAGGTVFYTGTAGADPQYPDSTNHIIDGFCSTTLQTTPVVSVLNTWHVASFHSIAGNWQYWKDGSQVYATATNTYAFNTSPQLARYASLSDFFKGQIGEIIFTNDFMSDADRQRCEGYLAWKWGTQASLPTGHPYKSAPP